MSDELMVRGLPERPLQGAWVQTERAAHEAWAALMKKNPSAAMLMHILVARLGPHNAVVISQKVLGDLMGKSRDTVKRAVATLRDDHWIDVKQIGDRGTVNAYIVNDRVAWTGKRDGIRYSLFSASVVVSEEEQPDRNRLSQQAALRRLPDLLPGEAQLPSGQGLPPISQPFFDGMEPDLPATGQASE